MIPLSTDRTIRCTPVVNYSIIGLNVLVALVIGFSPQSAAWTEAHAVLRPIDPKIWQFVTYQFLHSQDDFFHLAFNMLFLWIFGNALEDRFGPIGYACFYLAGGILAGLAHALTTSDPVIGASGAVSAVTGMFLALFPQTRIRVLWLLILISIFEIPSLWFISFSMVRDLWGQLAGGGNVAYLAHLGGNLFGLLLGLALLLTGLCKRDGYDLLSMIRLWRRRQHFRSVTGKGYDPWSGRRSAPPEAMKKTSTDPDAADNSRATDQPTDPADPEEIARTELRTRISECIRKTDLSTAGRLYEEGVKKWSTFILGAPNQLEIANHFFQSRSYDLAAHAYRRLLDVYHTSDPSGKLRLLLAVALVRYLDRPAEAAPYLEQAVQRLNDGPDRDLARDLLSEAQASSDQSQST